MLLLLAGPTPPAGRRVLPPLDDMDPSLRQSGGKGALAKAKKKGGPAPAPPMRTTSRKDPTDSQKEMENELKAKMKLQKAKIESCTLREHYDENGQEKGNISNDFAPTISLQPGKRFELNSPGIKRVDSKDGMKDNRMEDSGISQSSTESLKRAQIDKSKYLINTDSAVKSSAFEPLKDPNSGRKFSLPYQREVSRQDSFHSTGHNSKVDKDTNMLMEGGEGSQKALSPHIGSGGSLRLKQYPKVAIPLPQHAQNRRKYSDNTQRFDSAQLLRGRQTADMESASVTIGRLDVDNVTKSISRYGTIPKGRRIEAYLASMEGGTEQGPLQHEMPPPIEDHDSGTDTASIASCPCPVLLPDDEGVVRAKQPAGDSPLIKSESNVKPSSFVVKSQSQHTMLENQSPQGALLQRQLSDLTQGANLVDPNDPRVRHLPEPSKPKPSPRLSRMYNESSETSNHHDGHVDNINNVPPPMFGNMSESMMVQGHEPVAMDNRYNKHSDYRATQPKPMFSQKMRSSSMGDYNSRPEDGSPHEEGAHWNPLSQNNPNIPDEKQGGASFKSKMAMFQSQNPGFQSADHSSFKPFQRGEAARDSLRDDKSTTSSKSGGDQRLSQASKDDVTIYKPVLPKPPIQMNIMSKSMIDTLDTVPENYSHGQNSDSDTPKVSRQTILESSANLKVCLDSLNSVGNKTSTNFMLLTEQVLQFHDLCSNFIDSMAPHAKFHAKELLSRLQTHSESLNKFSSTNPAGGGKLITDIRGTVQEVIDLIQR